VTLNARGSNIKYLPYAFTEQGVAMLSSVLKSKVAVQVNIKIMRVFVETRHLIAEKPEYDILKEQIKRLESKSKTMSGELSELGEKVQEISLLFETFQENHIVIRRPDDGDYLG
jgi:hypothetical protein